MIGILKDKGGMKKYIYFSVKHFLENKKTKIDK